ncbi:MAG: hypothetical protein IPM26_02900 [Saprospiraceae bacterium]|jgi:hypothetical protein|nr:hypothetical protein [Saprospiraceae bacterium]
MKNNKVKKTSGGSRSDEMEVIKPKKKGFKEESKLNVRSHKFWEDVYDDEGEEIEKYLR